VTILLFQNDVSITYVKQRRKDTVDCLWLGRNKSRPILKKLPLTISSAKKILHTGLSWVRVPTGAGNFSLHHRILTGSEAHPASYPVSTRDCFPGGKATEKWSSPLTFI